MPELIALEPNVIQILHNKFQASVPTIIAQNSELNCFLMKDAGESLRSILKKKSFLSKIRGSMEAQLTLQAGDIKLFSGILGF